MMRQKSIVALLGDRRNESPSQQAYTFLVDGEVECQQLTFAELDVQARAIGALLQQHGAEGDRALLLYPPGLGFVSAFLGCLYGCRVAVPAYPPTSKHGLPRLLSILRDAQPAAILTSSSLLSGLEALCAEAPELRQIRWLATDELETSLAAEWRAQPVSSDTLALLQYTSGSTSTPRGVMVSHANLLHNQEMIRRAFGQTSSSIIVGWLPVYHDMGLIGNLLQPLHLGARCILMSPVAFLQRPLRWLQAIDRYRATTSGGPNFAYELCVRKIGSPERAGLDLSSWSVAFNGAEPVRPGTLRSFAAAFAPCGFRREAFYPCYGLAEATLFVTGGAVSKAPRTACFDAAALEEHRVMPRSDAEQEEPGCRRVVGCGWPWGELEVAIVEPQSRRRSTLGEVGEIWVSGPSVARGYWRRDEHDGKTFGARLSSDAEERVYLRTGDLGFVHEGELFVTGRLKDLIILRGRNHYPQDIEETAEKSHPALRPGCGAAFSVEIAGEERLVLAWELERGVRAPLSEIAAALSREISKTHEVQVHELVFLRFGAIPKTTSGKIQRHACRTGYLVGGLAELGRLGGAAPEHEVGAESELDSLGLRREVLAVLRKEERMHALVAAMRQLVARALRVPAAQVSLHQPLASLGLDSLAAIEIQHRLEERLKIAVPLAELLEDLSLERLGGRLLAKIDTQGTGETPPTALRAAPPVQSQESFPLSWGQEGLWALDRLDPAAGALHMAAAARVVPALDLGVLGRTLELLAARHPALRTTFQDIDGRPWQRAEAQLVPELIEHKLSEQDAETLPALLERETYRPFDLACGPLLRLVVVRRAAQRDVVLLVAHHLIADFWSLTILLREMVEVYDGEAASTPVELPLLPVSYRDFVCWQRARLEGLEGERLRAWWCEQLAGAPLELALPADRPRPSVQSFAGGARAAVLDPRLAAALESLARRESCTLFAVLLAGFTTLLSRLSGQTDFLIGSPASGRERAELVGLVGYCVGPVVLRADLKGRPSFRQLLGRSARTVLAALDHQGYPFPLLAGQIQPERDPSRPPVFQVMLVWQAVPPVGVGAEQEGLGGFAVGAGGVALRLGGWELESLPLAERGAQLDLTLRMAGLDGGLVASLQYNRDLFDASTMRRLLGQFEVLLAAAVADPDREVDTLQLLGAVERSQLLWEWNDTGRSADDGLCLHELFETQTRRMPEAIALSFAGDPASPDTASGRLSYGELNARANRLARVLRRSGVGPETRVGVCLERGAELAVALLAVLKAGGAYVPLDPGYPAERRRFMLDDSGAQLVLAQRPPNDEEAALADRPWVVLDGDLGVGENAQDLGRRAGPGNLAYLIYTSGSTGRPKGVAIEHRSPVALVQWARGVFAPEELAGVFAATSICFDLSIFELFVPWSWGGQVILAADALELSRHPAAEEVTLINTVPSVMTALLADRLPSSLRTVNLAGEPLRSQLVERLCAGGVERVLNLYGPSEDTTYSTWAGFEREACRGLLRVSIGRPVAGTRAHVLDARLQLVPVGATGELALAGEGLARGYLGRPALTAERFVPDPFRVQGERMYRTGDLVRRLPGGELDFLGRRDHQVKLRGFRIELGEVEAALTRLPGVAEAAVLVRELAPAAAEPARGAGAVLQLVAFVEGPALALTGEQLRAELAGRLPAHLLPARVLPLAPLPRTPNGKVDRSALRSWPLPAREGLSPASAAMAPTPIEELVAGIFGEVLRARSVAVGESFFELGGSSLLAMQVVARVREALGVELPVRKIFEAPTPAALAELVSARPRDQGPRSAPIEPLRRDLELPLSLAQERLWLVEKLQPGTPVYNVPAAMHLRGALDLAALAASLAEIVRRHEALRTAFTELDGQPVQRISPAVALSVPVIDLGRFDGSAGSSLARRLARDEARRGFDLGRSPLLRATVLRLGAAHHTLLLTFHHIVFDAWSLPIFAGELAACYGALGAGRPLPLAAPAVQPADFAVWQRRWLEGETLAGLVDFWRTQLADAPGSIALSSDRPRGERPASAGDKLFFRLDPAELDAVRGLARRRGATLYMTLLAGWKTLLYRSTRQRDLVVGSPVAGRIHSAVEGLIGFFVNNLVLRTRLAPNLPFGQLLRQVRETALAAFEHQDLAFAKLVEALQPHRDLGASPLYNVVFNLQTIAPWKLDLPGLEARVEEIHGGIARFDLTLAMEETREGLAGSLEYRANLFDRATILRMIGHLRALLRSAVTEPERSLTALEMLSVAERHQLAVAADAVATPYQPTTIHRLFQLQAERHPLVTALEQEGVAMSYRELDARSDAIARALLAERLGARAIIAVMIETSHDQVAALLAVSKIGACFVALDPIYPAGRLETVLAEARPAAIVVSARAAAERSALLASCRQELGCRVIELGEGLVSAAGAELPEVDPEERAFLVYTSGSTGRPKGIIQTHRSFCQFLDWQGRTFAFGPGVRAAHWSSISHDGSYCEIFGALGFGATALLAPAQTRFDPPRALRWLAQERAGWFHTVPSFWRQMLAALDDAAAGQPLALASLEVLELVGEPLPLELARESLERFPGIRLLNLYGPTEMVLATALEIGAMGAGWVSTPVGRALDGRQVLILGEGGELCPQGVRGKIHVRSPYLSQGYLDRPRETARVFLPDPMGERAGGVMYDTSDLGRWRGDGTLEFLGRLDNQVKIRGIRVEPEEVESVLARHEGVSECAVLAREVEPGDLCLVAYVVAAPDTDPSVLRAFLGERLPGAMIPSELLFLDQLPRTANRKIDRRALATLEGETRGGRKAVAPPRTPTETTLVEMVQALLKIEQIGIFDNFFTLGGHSLLATRLLARVRKTFDVKISLRDFFEQPTIAWLSAAIARERLAALGEDERARLLAALSQLSDEQARAQLAEEIVE